MTLAEGNTSLQYGLAQIYELFNNAPVLGSLIKPEIGLAKGTIFEMDWKTLSPILTKALNEENNYEKTEMSIVAQGISAAAQILAGNYHLVITNVPYLVRGRQIDTLQDYCEKHYPEGKRDLATVFLNRCLELCQEDGISAIVLPQNWLFLTSYANLRRKLLKNETWQLIARLGPGAFETISGEVVKAILLVISHGKGKERQRFLGRSASEHAINCIDVSKLRMAAEKAYNLPTAEIRQVQQAKQLQNPDARVVSEQIDQDIDLIEKIAESGGGASTFDSPRFIQHFWEHPQINLDVFVPCQSSPDGINLFTGRCYILKWQKGVGELFEMMRDKRVLEGYSSGIWIVWSRFIGKKGVLVSMMHGLSATLYDGFAFDNNTAAIIPKEEANLRALWSFCSSPAFLNEIRKIDQKLNVTSGTLVKIPFDLDYWMSVACEKYPKGLPKPHSEDPTQWVFHGHPAQSEEPLQVALARLLGYQWPAELVGRLELSDEARAWVTSSETLLPYADADGIICIPPVMGELRADDRLESLLAAAYGSEWSSSKNSELLSQVGYAGKTLESWLREKFFTQHCQLFHDRPFIWHIWDGLNDGFAALVNYHKLDTKLLEKLIYTYLGDWINRQKQETSNGVDGSEEKLVAAEALKKRLELILEGEKPYDIFVRWKPLEKQPIGWNPDLNDGVRLNIRPFVSVPDVGKKGAGVLRDKPNVNWDKDRGKDVESAPWYQVFKGERINDYHLSLTEKNGARKNAKSIHLEGN